MENVLAMMIAMLKVERPAITALVSVAAMATMTATLKVARPALMVYAFAGAMATMIAMPKEARPALLVMLASMVVTAMTTATHKAGRHVSREAAFTQRCMTLQLQRADEQY